MHTDVSTSPLHDFSFSAFSRAIFRSVNISRLSPFTGLRCISNVAMPEDNIIFDDYFCHILAIACTMRAGHYQVIVECNGSWVELWILD